MDKLLAMSILSSAPADIAGFWAMMMQAKKDSWKSSSREEEEKRPALVKGGQKGRAWIAPEFDGLNCFETFVAH